MWPKAYKDYPKDTKLIKNKVEPSSGIIGCEMHEINGWGETQHIPKKSKKKGFFRTLLSQFSKEEKEDENT